MGLISLIRAILSSGPIARGAFFPYYVAEIIFESVTVGVFLKAVIRCFNYVLVFWVRQLAAASNSGV